MFLPPGSKRIKNRSEMVRCKGTADVNPAHIFLKLRACSNTALLLPVFLVLLVMTQ